MTMLAVIPACGSESDEQRTQATSEGFSLISEAFEEGGDIPAAHALDGGNTSPPLAWYGVPGDAEELAITVLDPDASNFAHWVVWGIDAEQAEIAAGELPEGAIAGLNQLGESGWAGPAPPEGEEHTYVFTVHALSRTIELPATTPAVDALEAIQAATIGEAQLRGQFGG